MRHLKLGTRGSMLARTQSQQTADALMAANPGLHVELVILKTTGDQVVDQPLHSIGGKGLFTKELEQALLRGQIDFAVHSYKDVPVTMPLVDQSDLVVAAVPKREDPADVLICHKAICLRHLPSGARIGTGSLRRRSQVLSARPDLTVEMIRGNIDTRMRRAKEDLDAVILAAAGLRRSGLFDAACCHPLPELLPAAGQGALALQCRANDARTIEVLRAIDDPDTAACVNAERALIDRLKGDCHSPISAHATLDGLSARLRAAVGRRGGSPPVIYAEAAGEKDRLPSLVETVFTDLERHGALKCLHEGPA
jgi:hydroxymethylbilane synthase